MNLNELDLNKIGSWPKSVQWAFIGTVSLILLVAVYFLDLKIQYDWLGKVQDTQELLKTSYEEKWRQAANIEAYREQIKIMNQQFGNLLHELPEKNEVPRLVEDISRSGIEAGLTFKSIKLMPEKEGDFYVELPIQIAVTGTYHQFGNFISAIASLPRIVTIGDFDLVLSEKQPVPDPPILEVNFTAKTFRYTGLRKTPPPQPNQTKRVGP